MEKYKRNPSERQENLRQYAGKLADILEPGDLEVMDARGRVSRGLYYSALLRLEADPRNHVLVRRSQESDVLGGRESWTGSTLWKPSLRISPTYSRELRYRAKREAKAALERALENLPAGIRWRIKNKKPGAPKWKLLTLTMQHNPGTRTYDEVKRLNAAFDLLRKRDAWKKHVLAGIKGIEDRLTAKGSHVHAHILILARFWDQIQASAEWTAVLGSKGNARIQDIVNRRTLGGDEDGPEVSLEHAINETCKYITKTSDLLEPDADGHRVTRDTLIELCDIWRWPRMFELLGAARQIRQAPGAARLDLILTEYSTGRISNIEKEPVPWILNLSGYDSDHRPGWRILESGEPIPLESDPDPPNRRIRCLSWRELMLTLPAWEWWSIIEKKTKKVQHWRIRSLGGKANYPVQPLYSEL